LRRLLTISCFSIIALVASPLQCLAETAYALAPPFFLVQFDTATPSQLTRVVVVTGLAPAERLAAIDFRPRTGQLYGLGIVHSSLDTARVYRLDPFSGIATLIGSPFTIAASQRASLGFGFDFNPTVDRIRVVNDGEENLRINPNTGARADAPTTDTDLSPLGFQIKGVAYDRNFDTGLAVANRTTAYGISVATSSLVTIGGINQSPSPNGGAIQNQMQLTGLTGSLLQDSEAAFDIAPGPNKAFAALRDGTGYTRLFTINLATAVATPIGPIGSGLFDVTGLAVAPANTIVFGAGPGGGPHVRVFDAQTGAVMHDLFAYDPAFTGGVRVAAGDINGDGIPDIVTAPGAGGGPHVKVFNGTSAAALMSFFAYDVGFTGGVYVAAGDINGDGNKDVITGAGAGGGPQVRAFSGATGAALLAMFAYDPAFTGGVRVAAADFDRDGDAEIITAPGPGGGPNIRVFDASGAPFTSASLPDFVNNFFAYPSGFTGGVFVAAGDINGDGVPDIITGAGAGGGPHVKAFSGVDGAVLMSFFAYEPTFFGGVQVAVADVNGDGRYDIVTMSGPGRPATVTAVDGMTGALLLSSQPYGPFTGGAFVGGVRR